MIIIYLATVVLGLLFVLWFFKPVILSFMNRPAIEYQHQYMDPDLTVSGGVRPKMYAFPSLFDRSSVHLSLIVPAYNEENRLDPMMRETMEYLLDRQSNNHSFSFEVIIVDDGSTDKTAQVAQEHVRQYGSDVVRLMKLQQNQGKGGAVQQGMLHARGEYMLMVDADGATRIQDYDTLFQEMRLVEQKGVGVVIGSRAKANEEKAATRKWYRNLLANGFHLLVALFCVKGIRDTQCGFKLFTREAARTLFFNQHLRRWCFDVEILYIAQALNMPIVEVAVTWTEIPGSHIQIIESSLLMARDLVLIRLAYLFRIWKIVDPKPSLLELHGKKRI